MKISQLMLYREIIAVCSEIHIKHMNTICGKNVGFVRVKVVGYKAITQLKRVKVFFASSQEINLWWCFRSGNAKHVDLNAT